MGYATIDQHLRNTPWGAAQHIEHVGEGVWHVTTASHGGFWLDEEALKRIPQRHQDYAADWSHGRGSAWFEEDCAAYAVIAAFPALFPGEQERAAEVVAHWIERVA